MQKPAIGLLALIAGAAIGAGGYAALGPEKTHTVHDAASADRPAAATSTPAGAAHYTSAQAIADKLEASGFTVSMLHKSADSGTDMGMDAAYDFSVTEKPGPPPGDSGIDMFRSHQALDSWVELSKSLGGIAVTGDTWAISLASDNSTSAGLSKTMAPHIARVLGGTVQE